MMRGVIYLMVCIAIVGCDSFPGPVLRNEFPTEITVSILYGDGTRASGVWPPCREVFIGANEVGRFGMRKKEVSIDEITIELDEVVRRYDKEAIEVLLKKANDQVYPTWVLDSSGIRFSTDRECVVGRVQK